MLTATKRKTLSFLVGGLFLAIATPAYLGLTHDLGTYLLNPTILAVQAVPYVVAAGLWLPWRSARFDAVGQVLAAVLFVAAALLYVPMLTGLWPMGGDMVALALFLIAIVTTAILVAVTIVAFGAVWLRGKRSGD